MTAFRLDQIEDAACRILAVYERSDHLPGWHKLSRELVISRTLFVLAERHLLATKRITKRGKTAGTKVTLPSGRVLTVMAGPTLSAEDTSWRNDLARQNTAWLKLCDEKGVWFGPKRKSA